MIDRNRLLGRWRIESWEQRYDDGRITHPMGQGLDGFIQYEPEGRMVCMMARADRPVFTTGGQWDASTDERAQAYSGFMAYTGTFSVDGKRVTHHVELSLYPGWKGGRQEREVQFIEGATPQQDRLNIVARLEEGTSQARSAVLAWTRSSEH